MKKAIIIIIVVVLAVLGLKLLYRPSPATIADTDAQLILFWGNGCPHCEKVKEYISQNRLDTRVKIASKEVYYNQANQKLLESTVKNCPQLDTSQGIGVPLAYLPQTKECLLGDTPIIDWLAATAK